MASGGEVKKLFVNSVQAKDTETVRSILQLQHKNDINVDVEAVNDNGESCLMIALKNQDSDMLGLLIEHGADFRSYFNELKIFYEKKPLKSKPLMKAIMERLSKDTTASLPGTVNIDVEE